MNVFFERLFWAVMLVLLVGICILTTTTLVYAQVTTWGESPYNYNNSEYNYKNSSYNYNNSPYNYNNSEFNIYSPNNIYSNQGQREGYVAPNQNGVANYFDNSGNRVGYGR